MAVRRQSNARTGTGTLFGRAAIYARISLDKVGEGVDEVLVDNDLSAYSGACRPEKTASGRFTAQVPGAAAEHESARIGERVSAKHHQNAERGNAHGGGRSYGYRRVAQGQIEVVPKEASVVRDAAARVLGGLSLASIVIDLNERGIPSALGKKWRPGSLGMVLRSGRITGLRESKGTVVGEANWEPILDRATWEQVCSRLTHAPIGRRPKVNLLAGMCRCAECGSVMAAVSERRDKQLRPGSVRPVGRSRATRRTGTVAAPTR